MTYEPHFVPLPGDIGLVTTPGWAGLGIKFGEFLVDGKDEAQHAFMLLDDGTVIGAEPGPDGARIRPLSDYDGQTIWWVHRDLCEAARVLVVEEARRHEHERYDWWAYLWLASVRFGFRPQWVKRRMDDPSNDMCSQMVDRIYRNVRARIRLRIFIGRGSRRQPDVHPSDIAALTLFDDGRDPGNVTPGDLWAIHDPNHWTRTPKAVA